MKKHSGATFENALRQIIKASLLAVGDHVLALDVSGSHVFLIIARGFNISFFEQYNYVSLLEEEGIPNYEGCIPLTQSVDILRHPNLSENADLLKLLPAMRDASSKKRGHRFSYANDGYKSHFEIQLE